MLAIPIDTPRSMMQKIATRFRDRRLFLGLSQQGLSERSGVSLGTLKRFEHSGQIALESLLKLSVILECLEDFHAIASPRLPAAQSIEELIAATPKKPKRGRKK